MNPLHQSSQGLIYYPNPDVNTPGFARGADFNVVGNSLPGPGPGARGSTLTNFMLSSTGSEQLYDFHPHRLSNADHAASTRSPPPSASITLSNHPKVNLSFLEGNRSFSTRSSPFAPHNAYYHGSPGISNTLTAGPARTFTPFREERRILEVQLPFRVPSRVGNTISSEYNANAAIVHSKNMNLTSPTQPLWSNHNIASLQCEPNTPLTSLYGDAEGPGPHALSFISQANLPPPHKKPSGSGVSTHFQSPSSLVMAIQQKAHPSQRSRAPPPAANANIVAPTPQSPTDRPAVADPIEAQQSTDVHHRLEKKHGCWMCHKSFDRPSTLRKHLLVHTGEKAFVCDACGRRFGVNSNLNRHMKRCQLRNSSATPEEEEPSENRPDAETAADTPVAIPESLVGYALPATASTSAKSGPKAILKKRQSISSSTSSSTAPPGSTGASPIPSQASPKRRRRPPSPIQWVPESLIGFNLFPIEFTKSTPVPLPPVSAYQDPRTSEWIEERDSYDEHVGVNPYHPRCWRGKLPGPGPGFGGKDVTNLDLVGYGGKGDGDGGAEVGYVMGRLILT